MWFLVHLIVLPHLQTCNSYLFEFLQEQSSQSRRGSCFYDFVSSMRANDTFRLFSSGPVPAVTKTSHEASSNEEPEAEMLRDYDEQEKDEGEDLILLTETRDLVQQRLVGFIFVV